MKDNTKVTIFIWNVGFCFLPHYCGEHLNGFSKVVFLPAELNYVHLFLVLFFVVALTQEKVVFVVITLKIH